MIHPTDPNHMIGGCSKHPGQSFLNCYYCHLDKNTNVLKEKPNKKKKQPTGIIADLKKIQRFDVGYSGREGMYCNDHKKGKFVEWSDVEAIINKYLNP